MHEVLAFAASVALLILYRYFSSTDTPKIKNLPEIPGVPVFGNLLQLGNAHAQVAAKWAKKYGPVFQVRMGNKASSFRPMFSLFLCFFVSSDES